MKPVETSAIWPIAGDNIRKKMMYNYCNYSKITAGFYLLIKSATLTTAVFTHAACIVNSL